MNFIETSFADLIVCEPTVHKDERGYFFEAFNQNTFSFQFPGVTFVQDNEAMSGQGVLRGLHYQRGNKAQAKLVRVIQGEVLDVVVDLRKEQPTYGKWFSIRLSSENQKQLFVPRGFAHGYLVLSETALFFYKCDNFYSKADEGGIRYDDPNLNIDWQFDHSKLTLSPKDLDLPLFGAHINIF